MSEKKIPGRFTIQFNMNDPEQNAAAQLLEEKGRHKAIYIAMAILHLSSSQSKDMRGYHDDVLEDKIRKVLAGYEKEGVFSIGDGVSDRRKEADVEAEEGSPAHAGIDIAAISQTLMAFDQQ